MAPAWRQRLRERREDGTSALVKMVGKAAMGQISKRVAKR